MKWNDRSIDSKVRSLLSQMTLAEKIGQMVYVNCKGNRHEDIIKSGMAGTVANVHGSEEMNRLQRLSVEETRLGIPLLNGNDVIQGYRTIFPVPLAEACSWDAEIVERSAAIAAKEAVSAGTRWIYAPMLDVARDPRWGRIVESAGEDTYLNCVFGRARVRGYKKSEVETGKKVITCAKHFVGYGACEGGRDYNTADISENVLRNVYLPPFKACIDEGVESVMTSFNEVFGIPVAANKFLLKEILRKELGFEGIIVTDCNAIFELINHGIASSPEEACKKAIYAGVDMDMNSNIFMEHLEALVKEGTVAEDIIDRSVYRVIYIKYWLGLFDDPYSSPDLEKSVIFCEEHKTAALDAARKSMALLKNSGNILPFSKTIKKLAVIGPLADDGDAPLGWWRCNGRADDTVTVLQGIENKLGENCEILYTRGCDISGAEENRIKEAVKIAGQADAAIVVLGESARMSGEAHSRSDIGLPGIQEELLKAVFNANRNTVVVLINGRPLALPWIDENIPAILEAWQPGSQCGNAVADILFGDCCPSGKLVVSIPRSVGQLPVYYNHKTTGRPPIDTGASKYLNVPKMPSYPDPDTTKYIDIDPKPLYPFGYGLSYTKFEYKNIRLSANKIKASEKLAVHATIKNTGAYEADEVVQLYIQDIAASITRPVKELRGFKKVHLAPGEESTVEFIIGQEEIGFYNFENKFTVEPGIFRVWVAPDSSGGLEASFEVIN